MFPLALSLVLANSALAETPSTRSVTLPTGKTVEAQVMTPEAGSLEAQTLEAMKMAKAGKHDAWISQFCGPTLCEGPDAIASVKRLNLTSAQRTVGQCFEGNKLVVTKVKGDRESENRVTLYTWCGEGRMPAPVTWERTGESWKIASFSW